MGIEVDFWNTSKKYCKSLYGEKGTILTPDYLYHPFPQEWVSHATYDSKGDGVKVWFSGIPLVKFVHSAGLCRYVISVYEDPNNLYIEVYTGTSHRITSYLFVQPKWGRSEHHFKTFCYDVLTNKFLKESTEAFTAYKCVFDFLSRVINSKIKNRHEGEFVFLRLGSIKIEEYLDKNWGEGSLYKLWDGRRDLKEIEKMLDFVYSTYNGISKKGKPFFVIL